MQFATIVALFATLAVAKRSHRAAGGGAFNVTGFKAKCDSKSGGNCNYTFNIKNPGMPGNTPAACTTTVPNKNNGLLPSVGDSTCDNGIIFTVNSADGGGLTLQAKEQTSNTGPGAPWTKGKHTIGAGDLKTDPNTGAQTFSGQADFPLDPVN